MTKKQYDAEQKRILDAILERIRNRPRAEWIEMIEKIEKNEPVMYQFSMDQIRPSSRKKPSGASSKT